MADTFASKRVYVEFFPFVEAKLKLNKSHFGGSYRISGSVLCVCEQVLSDMPIPVLHLTQPLGRTVCPMQIQADMPGPRVAAFRKNYD